MKAPTSKISHVDLVVSSIQRSLPFYRGLLEPIGWSGLREVPGEQGETIYYLSVDGPGVAALGLREKRSDAHTVPYDRYAVGVHHVCFDVPSREAVDERAQWLREQGARIESGPAEHDYTPGYYAVFFYDPDGIKLELLHRPTYWEWLTGRRAVSIEPWSERDLALLQKLLGDPAMMEHLGGPESAEKIAERQARYERAYSGQFKIVDAATREKVGWVGYWGRTWRGDQVYEIGWSVLPAFQGKGIAAAAALRAIAAARTEGRHRFLHAYPSVDNAPSNAICRKLGFTLLGPCDFEHPPGHLMQCNDWRFDLRAA